MHNYEMMKKQKKKAADISKPKARITISLDLDLMKIIDDIRARERPIPSLTRIIDDILRRALGLPERKRKRKK